MLKDFLQGKWLGHPLHPAVVHVPMGLWPSALVFDLLTQFGIGGVAMVRVSFFAILLGLLMVFIAVPTGLADFSEIKREKPAWTIGLYHMGVNLLVAILFAVNLGLRTGETFSAEAVPLVPLLLSLVGTVLLAVSWWLGGLMSYDHGIGVARESKKKWRESAEKGGANLPE